MTTVTDTVVFDLSHPKALEVFKRVLTDDPVFSVDEEIMIGKASGHFYQVFESLALNRGQSNHLASFNDEYARVIKADAPEGTVPMILDIPEGTRFKLVDPILEKMCKFDLFESPATQMKISGYLINGIPVNIFSTIEKLFDHFTMVELARYLKLAFYPTGDANHRRFNLGILPTKYMPSRMFSTYKDRDLGVRMSVSDVMWAVNNQNPATLNSMLTHLFNLLICQNGKSEEDVEKLRISANVLYSTAVPFYGLCTLPGQLPEEALSILKVYLNEALFECLGRLSEAGEAK